MKILAIEQLSAVAGAEPRGTTNGRQNDGTDITRSSVHDYYDGGYYLNVHYSDSTYMNYDSTTGKSTTHWDGYRP